MDTAKVLSNLGIENLGDLQDALSFGIKRSQAIVDSDLINSQRKLTSEIEE